MKLQVYTTLFLIDENKHVLLLKRASWKKFAPNKFTGIGGRVESNELDDIKKSALREFEEETKIPVNLLSHLRFRGTKLSSHKDQWDSLIYYYLAEVKRDSVKDLSCTEGMLEWHSIEELPELDFIHDYVSSYSYIFDSTIERFDVMVDDTTNKFKTKLRRIRN